MASMPSLSSSPFLIFLLCLLFVDSSLSDPRVNEAALVCGNKTASPSDRPSFTHNFISAMSSVTAAVLDQGFANQSFGSGSSTVNVFAQCMKDLSPEDCKDCLSQCHVQILRCLPFQNGTRAGRLFLDGCYLRYDDHDFANETFSPEDVTLCGSTDFEAKKQPEFRAIAVELLGNLSAEAPRTSGFNAGSVSRGNLSVYGLAQCWKNGNASACGRCLTTGVSKMEICLSKEEGRVLNAGCYLRYSTYKFYNNSDSYASGGVHLGGGGCHLVIILSLSFWMFFS